MKSTKELIDPILDVFSGADGGAAFVTLRHVSIPSFISIASDTNDPQQAQAAEMLEAFNKVSVLCKIILNKS